MSYRTYQTQGWLGAVVASPSSGNDCSCACNLIAKCRGGNAIIVRIQLCKNV